MALVTAVGRAEIRRAGAQTRLPAYKGDLLFPGDTLDALSGTLTVAFCPTSSTYSVPGGELSVQQLHLTLNGAPPRETGKLPFCRLPGQPESAPQPPDPALFDSALQANPQDLPALIARAVAFESASKFDQAARDYQTIAELAPKAAWAADERRKVIAQRDRMARGEGRIVGLVIGIAEYPNLPAESQLHYPDRDAEDFYRFLISARGGARPADVILLEDAHAQLGDVRVAIANTFARASETDTVVIFIASHGAAVEQGPNAGAYILTYNSDPQNLPDTALRMDDLQDLTGGKTGPRQVRLFVDACKSGIIGTIRNNRFNLFEEEFLNRDRPVTEVLGLLASRRREDSFECSNFGHGAFSYFLLRGLNTTGADAVDPRYGQVTVNSLSNYVTRHVSDATKQRQNPEMKGNLADRIELANKDIAGAALPLPAPAAEACEIARGVPSPARKIEPPQAGQPPLAALENAGQEIVLQYLKGEESPLTRADFLRCENLFAAAAKLLDGGDAFVNGRLLFARGRRLIFDKNLPAAIAVLQEAIRADIRGAYAYNALGIAYLESAEFPLAIAAFSDAVRLAPQWAYARHNLALTLTEQGQYGQAIAAYREAMRLGAAYSYIPFNLGLLYQRLNRPDEARRAWQLALAVSPQMTRAWDAIGVSYFLERRFDQAEAAYRKALGMANNATDTLAVRHDLALLLSARGQAPEAIGLWRENLKQDPADIPSLIGLSGELAAQGKSAEALPVLAALLKLKPEYTGARLKYAKLLLAASLPTEAAAQLEIVLSQTKDNAEAAELLAGLRTSDPAAALVLYRSALRNSQSRGQRARIRRAIQALSPSSSSR